MNLFAGGGGGGKGGGGREGLICGPLLALVEMWTYSRCRGEGGLYAEKYGTFI